MKKVSGEAVECSISSPLLGRPSPNGTYAKSYIFPLSDPPLRGPPHLKTMSIMINKLFIYSYSQPWIFKICW